jgi:hypothetical protein
MHRTQVYLDHAIHARLKALAKQRGRTIADLVREALARVYGSNQTGEGLATLRGIAGLWRDREDLGDTDAYVRWLRRDTLRKQQVQGIRALANGGPIDPTRID